MRGLNGLFVNGPIGRFPLPVQFRIEIDVDVPVNLAQQGGGDQGVLRDRLVDGLDRFAGAVEGGIFVVGTGAFLDDQGGGGGIHPP